METNRIILDTSAYSAFLRGNPEVKNAIQHADEICINPIIMGELLAGFSMGRKKKKNIGILQEFLSSERVQVITIDEETSERYATIIHYLREKGTPIPTNDIWIAASAMQFGLKIVTTDSHYLKVPQVIVEMH